MQQNKAGKFSSQDCLHKLMRDNSDPDLLRWDIFICNQSVIKNFALISYYLQINTKDQIFAQGYSYSYMQRTTQGWLKWVGRVGRLGVRPPPIFWLNRRRRWAVAACRITTYPLRFSDLAPSLLLNTFSLSAWVLKQSNKDLLLISRIHYSKVASSRLPRLVVHPRIFRMFM